MIKEHPSKTSAFFREGRGQKFAKFADGRGVGVKNRENLPMSKMDGPLGGKDTSNLKVSFPI